ncbi:curlin [Lacinutrix sp. 5H-3-7-4]|uniref:curlin n=1 Tax=Lacinutrix sp. (strain 5H-3-7-4) TaxID=983544 RepID=UPI00020A393B|nr:curlin [Lacinutrix sp. 5H-3-7-4]AEH00144.1 Curlin associated repeat-containing protein [Lacinutrix sp. 5H-3-7-4]
MKKVILGASALLFTGAIFAQSPVSQDDLKVQNGSNSVDTQVAVDYATGNGNTGEAIQTGNTNKLQVMQAGTNQSSYSVQADGTGTGDNRARIWQTGEVSAASGVGNAADVRQMGSGNQSTTLQEGDLNEAVTRQGMKDGGASGGNRALIHHGTGQQGEMNYAMIEQDGQDNRAKTRQQFDNNQARTVQEGDDNVAGVFQNSGPDGSDGNTAIAEQYGDENVTRIDQDGSRNKAHSVQEGDLNISNQYQTGDDNTALVDQGADVNPINDFGASQSDLDAFIVTYSDAGYTDGTDNTGMGSTDARALQVQDGDANTGYIGQWGDSSEDSDYAEQNQTGDNNVAYIAQNAHGVSNGGANYGRQDQTGDVNGAILGQNGRNHLAYQRQYGDGNIVSSSQKGDSNLVSTYQSGDENVAFTGQRGLANQTLIVQKSGIADGSGHSFKASQNIPDGMSNGGNTISVLQLGPNGDLMNDGENCDFQEMETLITPGGPGSFDLDAPCGGSGC